MSENLVSYRGKSVSRDKFRAFVYAKNGSKRVAEGWAEYKKSLDSGEWFDTAKAAFNAWPERDPKVDKKKESNRTSEGKK